jgi:uncharacterized protein YjbI with pentapeptide repeats
MGEKTKKSERSRDRPRRLPAADEFNAGTEEHLLSGMPLEDLCFSDVDLSARRIPAIRGGNLVFDRVAFARSEIASFRLFDARFVGCDLSNAMLRACEATRVEFVDCKLTGLNAFGCRFEDVLMERCDASFSHLSKGRLHRCEIVASQFREAALNGMSFEGTRMNNVVLRKADLAEANLMGLDLTSCDIEEISLRVTGLRGAIVSPAQAMDLARFLEVVVR